MTTIDKIRAEIKKLQDIFVETAKGMETEDEATVYSMCAVEFGDELLAFLDTLPDEPVTDCHELVRWHDLKILPEYFQAVKSGEKTFEVRFNDRNFQKSDILHLREWNGIGYTGESIYVKVTYILDNPDCCKEGYVIMAIRRVNQKEEEQ